MIANLATAVPSRRAELVIRPLGNDGQCVVKDSHSGEFFHLGEQEAFLLAQLDGQKDEAAVCGAFVEHFGEPLSEEDLDGFIAIARERGLVQSSEQGAGSTEPADAISDASLPAPSSPLPGPSSGQSLLYWRKTLFDPDRLCTWLEPRIRFFWTPAFLALSAGSIAWAVCVVWLNRHELAGSFRGAMRWETFVLVWLTMLAVTTLHEFAHGLTCKHYGGEVHEIGFLLMFFVPCFYCNVSDAWLFREKSKRLWVTFAGGYFELFVWSLAVFAWRVTLPGTTANYLACIMLTMCGVQTLFNFNPLIKLDGYYLLSDWLEVPNLQYRGIAYFKEHWRWLLWGAPRPTRQPRGKALLCYGAASWLYSLVFVSLMLWGMFQFSKESWGLVGIGGVAMLGLVSTRGLVRDLAAGEARQMITKRRKRLAGWIMVLACVAAVLCFVKIEDQIGGSVRLRPLVRAEMRSPVSGFLKEIFFDEGDRVSLGAPLARVEVPDLASLTAQKQAEVREAQANLNLLEKGTRHEELAEQRQRVARARAWRDLAEDDLAHAQKALKEELARLEKQIAQCRVERDTAGDALQRAQSLRGKAAVTEEQYREADRRFQVAQTQLAQAQFQMRHREALGTREAIAGLDAQAELARREKDLADTQGALTLMEAGTRGEAIEAARARLARLNEEEGCLRQRTSKLLVTSTAPGLITTPRLKERVGQYVREGELICLVEEPASLECEVSLAEQDMARVMPGQGVELKARALPFETFSARVERIAPATTPGEIQGTVTVYCRLASPTAELRPGLTGYARVSTGQRPIGEILVDRVLRFLRTEFWW